MKQLLAVVLLANLGVLLGPAVGADDKEPQSAKEALQALNDFIGSWKGSGGPETPRPNPKDTWSETVNWSWRFKGDDAWLTVAFKSGKAFKNGELRYLLDKKRYQLTAITRDDKKLVFEGELKDEVLTLERLDTATKETQRFRMNLAGDGARFICRYDHKPVGRTVFTRDFLVACTKEGESLGATAKKVECVVSGGLGTIQVSYKGTTYYVCCTGCRDAFLENPEKYIKEYEAKKAKK
jgi:hypothetical protein